MKKNGRIWLPVLSVMTAALLGCGGANQSPSPTQATVTQAAAEDGGGVTQSAGVEKVTICHIPPGNPENAHLITVGAPAVAAHVAHGDPEPPSPCPTQTPS